jgi:hypothetical protein
VDRNAGEHDGLPVEEQPRAPRVDADPAQTERLVEVVRLSVCALDRHMRDVERRPAERPEIRRFDREARLEAGSGASAEVH